jgi:hypothetical protein
MSHLASAGSRTRDSQTKSLPVSTRVSAARSSGAAASNVASAPESRTRVSCRSQNVLRLAVTGADFN